MEEKNPFEKSLKMTLAGVIVNLIFAFGKGLTGVLGNSFALVADAIESAADIITSLVVFLGIKIASKKPTKRYPYGHGKAEPIAASVVSVMLIAAGVVIIVNSIRNIRIPHEVPEWYTLLVLAVVIVVKEILYRRGVKVGEEVGSTAVKADAWHHRGDAITSGAAFIGIAIALIGGPGYESADDWAALVASGFIIYNAFRILKPAVSEIMDAAPPEDMINDVMKMAQQVEGVLGLDKCYIRKMGFEYFVDLHVVVDGEVSVRTGHDIAHNVKDEILKKDKRVRDVFVHIEPFDEGFRKK